MDPQPKARKLDNRAPLPMKNGTPTSDSGQTDCARWSHYVKVTFCRVDHAADHGPGPQEGHFSQRVPMPLTVMKSDVRSSCLQCNFSLPSFSSFQSFPLRCCAPMCPAEAHAKFWGFAWICRPTFQIPVGDYKCTVITPHQGCQSGFKNLGFRYLKNQKNRKSPNFKFLRSF